MSASAQSGVRCGAKECPLLGAKRTWAESANSDLARSQLIFGNLRHQSIAEGFCGRGRREKHVAKLEGRQGGTQSFDRTGLLGLVQDLYAVDRDNQAFLHARLGLGSDQLGPYKAIISRWICPDLMGKQSVSISKAKKAITDYRKAIGQPAGLAELSIFYCEEAFSLVESCAFEDERYFVGLIHMYDRAVQRVLDLPAAERHAYAERLGRLRSRARWVGWGVEDEFNSIWYEAGLGD